MRSVSESPVIWADFLLTVSLPRTGTGTYSRYTWPVTSGLFWLMNVSCDSGYTQ